MRELKRQRTKDLEQASTDKNDAIARHDAASASSGSDIAKELDRKLSTSKAYAGTNRVAVVHGLTRPLFHIDLTSALQSAVANVERRGEGGVTKGVGT